MTGPQDEISESASSLWETTLDALPRVGVATLVVGIGWIVAHALRWVLRRAFGRRRTPSFSLVMSKLISWVFLGVVVLLAVAVTFPSVKPVDVLAGLGFFSVAVGFAFQDILENSLSGMLLLFRQPFRSGDQIEVVGQSGTVDEINIRETRITTYDGELVIIPNRDVYKNAILVNTFHPVRRRQFSVGIAFESDAEQATRVVVEALKAVPGVVADPPPLALIDELGVSTINIRALFWTGSRQLDSVVVLDRAIKGVKAALDAAGIEMPADIVSLRATPSFQAAMNSGGPVTPGGQAGPNGRGGGSHGGRGAPPPHGS
ncbi:MAG: mechanosensitive ion channel family protein [Ilumatobacteraceae bacterium]